MKTGRLDARNLARLYRAGELTCVRVPALSEEAARGLLRAREEIKSGRRIARQRIRSFLLRYGKRYPGASDRRGTRCEVWARALSFDEPAAQAAFEHLLAACFMRGAQLSAMDSQIEDLASLPIYLATSIATTGTRGAGAWPQLLVVAPHPEHLHGALVFKNLIHEPVLDADAAGIGA